MTGGLQSGKSIKCLIAAGIALFHAAIAVPEEKTLVTTSAMLEKAAMELGADEAGFRLVNLQPPGSCPGHFDVRPRSISDLRAANLILCHNYQTALRERLGALQGVPMPSIISTPGSFLIPTNYRDLLSQVTAALQSAAPAKEEFFQIKKQIAHEHWEEQETALAEIAGNWKDIPVIASAMQRDFCEWLGMNIVGVLPRPDDLTPRGLAVLLNADAVAVVGNLQSDGEASLALGKRMGIPVAVLSNFPGVEGYGESVGDLLQANLRNLRSALNADEAMDKSPALMKTDGNE